MMMKEKMTKKEKFEMLATVIGGGDATTEERKFLVDFINKEIALLEAKKDKSKKANAENDVIAGLLLEVLAEQKKAVTVAELLEDDRLATYTKDDKVVKMSGPKLTAIISKLKNSGEVVRTEVKKRAYFSLKGIVFDTESESESE